MEQLQSLLANFADVLRASVQELQNVKSFSNYPIVLAKNTKLIANKVIRIGNLAYEKANSDSSTKEERLLSARITFAWVADAKETLILWRDSLFEAQKAQLLHAETKATAAQLLNFKSISEATISKASEALISQLEAIVKKDYKAAEHAKYEIQNSPYPTYQAQLEQIPIQCTALLQQSKHLLETIETFVHLREEVQKNGTAYQVELGQLKSKAEQIITFIEEHQAEKRSKIIPFIREQEEALNTSFGNTATALDELIATLPNAQKIVVASNGGILLYKDINFQKNVQQWLETEILPKLHELYELKESIKQNLKMAFLNISNRIVILANQKQEDATNKSPDLRQPLHTFLQQMTLWQNQFNAQLGNLQQQLDDELRISNLYSDSPDFLSIPLQATINQLRHHPSRWLDKLQQWWNKQWGIVQDIQRSSKQAEALSISEKLVRIIQSRSHDAPTAYTNIFLTHGYIGEAFCVGREDELAHIEQLISAWQKGFRGAVLLSGQRFSGKTLFGERVADRYFPKQTIRIAPNNLLEVEGRRMTSDYDLGKSLDFIRKYSVHQQNLIWIDDLELWHDQSSSLGDNIAALSRYMEKYYNSFFFLVAMGNGLKKRLQDFYTINNQFQAEINLDAMSLQEIQSAILTRHSATHRQLLLADGKELSPKVFQKISRQIYRATEGNIGDALAQWAFATVEGENNTVIYQPKEQYAMPNFLDADMAILLRALILEKRSNEYRLRKLFGEIFKERYNPILQRLLGVGILNRQIDGWLEINAVIANDIGRSLEEQQFLSLRYNK